MRCRDIMNDVECCFIDDPVADVADRMRSRHVGFLPVCNAYGQVIGTITDRDLTTRVLADRLPGDVPVQAVMSRGPITCKPDDLLEDAEQLMERYYKWRIVCCRPPAPPRGRHQHLGHRGRGASLPHRQAPARSLEPRRPRVLRVSEGR